MNDFLDRKKIKQKLRDIIEKERLIIGAGVGSGFAAKYAEEGGADILFLFNSGRFRMAGVPSLAGYLPYANANDMVINFGVTEIIPKVKNIPVIAGLCATDPKFSHSELLETVKNYNFSGVINYPTMSIINGNFRLIAEEQGYGFDNEVNLIKLANEMDIFTVAFVQNEMEAEKMLEANADVICVHFGFTSGGEGNIKTFMPLNDAVNLYCSIYKKIIAKKNDQILMVYGGPLGYPESIRNFLREIKKRGAKVHGYIGGSAIDSNYVRETITSLTHLLKGISQQEISKLGNLVGSSQSMQNIYEIIMKVAPSDITVLVTGESGTGKELVAEAIHELSLRKEKPLIKINCANLPENLLESELFGHEAGAFTGAIKRHIGKFELANGGTLVLDEIGEIPLSLQAKLLRVIENQEFYRVGGEKLIKVDVRIIACTNKDLSKLVKEGKFREDLFWRLNVININMPPLRMHLEDLPEIVEEIVKRYCKKHNKSIPKIDPNLIKNLKLYNWPGNVRELENFIHTLLVFSNEKMLSFNDKAANLLKEKLLQQNEYEKETQSHLFKPHSKYEIENKILIEVLEQCNFNKTKAAEKLGISRRTLYNRLKKMGYDKAPFNL
ncbi:MAG: phosphoenolpyruvate hydrolase family protein [Thermovenabulum sp.]|uniref:phosphoenolpyruvate hydrolase family protein n=1 Tax=Thermovenabulum sp. TaxID=3100335 RepID=UPI003C7E85EB